MRNNTWAIIEDGLVVNTILWDGIQPYNPGSQYTLIDISADEHDQVSIGWSYNNGVFSPPAKEPDPEPTHEQLVSQAESEKYSRLSSADSIFLEWQTKLLLNIASEDEKNAVIAWVNYKDAVRAVDTNEAPNITWPEQPPIPEIAQ